MGAMTNSPFVESLKEVGRYVLLGVVSWLLTGGIQIILGFFKTQLTQEMSEGLILVLTLILRGVDKYLHEKAPMGVSDGLTRF